MRMQRKKVGVLLVAMLATALTTLGFAGSASAKLTGEFTKFQFCPYTNPEVARCVHSLTTDGEVVLGSKAVPIVNQVTLQGGYTEPAEEGPEASFAKFFAATNGVTLSKAPQPVPCGLLGLVPPEGSPPLVKALVELAAENGLTGVNSTLELARPASEIRLSESHLAEAEGIALKLPVKVRLENPLLGTNCYVGSSSSPIWWELTTGKTSPPGPNEPITGSTGEVAFREKFQIVELKDAILVDNAWSAPAAKGCGGPLLSLLIDPIVNSTAGLPSAAGNNTAILQNTISSTTSFALNKNNNENP